MQSPPTLAEIVARNAAFSPGKVAIGCEDSFLTYGEFSARTEQLANALAFRFGVARGDRVAYLGLNSPDLLILLFACARLGAILAPLNWRLAPPELAFIIANAEPKLLAIEAQFSSHLAFLTVAAPQMEVIDLDRAVSGSALLEALGPQAQGAAPITGRFEDPVLLVYTSGTTGHPKGALLSQASLYWNAIASTHMHGLSATDHVLTVLPMFHVGGLNIQTTPALLVGASITLHPRFVPAPTLASISEVKPSLTVLVPATLEALLAEPSFAATDFTSLRAITTGSTFVPEALVETFAGRGVRLLQVYGATETGPISVYERFDQPRDRRDTTGLPGVTTKMRILDEAGRIVPSGTPGEVALMGPQIFSGYWRNDEATAAAFRDGWFLTGDIGVTDAQGHLFLRDRKNNVIISGGENIYPAEVERVIGAFAGVAECAVVGIPDPRWQEVPIAYVVPHAQAPLDIEALSAHLAANLGRFKLPRRILLRDALPRNAMGKVQHFVLKSELAASLAADKP
ncbi:MAG: AMP-binding protein [Hyphomicrobiales bacterium]|nr:AMP-binding protein [Hyphomicrobiales bacterium]